jgi:hypothetical protein
MSLGTGWRDGAAGQRFMEDLESIAGTSSIIAPARPAALPPGSEPPWQMLERNGDRMIAATSPGQIVDVLDVRGRELARTTKIKTAAIETFAAS